VNIHTTASLWKTLVEKPVENVENFELSTGILLRSGFPQFCGISAYACAYGLKKFPGREITSPGAKGQPGKNPFRKVYKR